MLTSQHRLTTPLLRERGALRPVCWETALDFVADRITELQATKGKDAVAVFGGAGLTNEKAYLLDKFARLALGTALIGHSGRTSAAAVRAFGVDRGLPFPLRDLADADTIMLAGVDTADIRHRTDAQLITVGPGIADLNLYPAPGTEPALAIGLLHLAVTEGGLDQDYVDHRTSGFAAVWRIAARWWPERVARITGVSVSELRECLRLLTAGRAYLLSGPGTEQHAAVSAWINLCLALGLPGRSGCGYGRLAGRGNGQGGRELDHQADQFWRPALDDPAAGARVAGVWGVDPAELPVPGRWAYALLDSLGAPHGPEGLLTFGADLARHAGQLPALGLLVIADLNRSPTTELADVVLPVTRPPEEDATLVNAEGRILLRPRQNPPRIGTRSELAILHDLALRLGQPPSRFPVEPEQVFAELRQTTAGGPADCSGADYTRLRAGESLFWPVPAPDSPGTPHMFRDRFAHPDGLARFRPVEHLGPAEARDTEFVDRHVLRKARAC